MVFHKESKNLKTMKLVFVHLKKRLLRAKKFRLHITLNSKLLFLLLRVDIPNMVKSGTLNKL